MKIDALSSWIRDQKYVVAASFLGCQSFVYRLGNLFTSVNAKFQAEIAARFGGDYGIALAIAAGTVAVLIAMLTALGGEVREMSFVKDGSSPGVA